MRNGFRLGAIALVCTFLAACASSPTKVLPEKTYYDRAHSAMEGGNYSQAEKNLQDIETYYPFGRYAEQAQLDLIYVQYKSLNLDGASSAAGRFLRLHPQSPHADYALYMKGLADYYMDYSVTEKYLPLDVDARAPGAQTKAFRDFSQMLNQFPNSPYAPDAHKRMEAIRNRLAQRELRVADYYIKREAYLAAANRCRYIVQNYPHAPAVERALRLEVQLDRKLGMDDAAHHALVALAANFPNSKAFDSNMHFVAHDIKPQNRSLLNAVTFGLLGNEKKSSNQ